MKTRFNAPLMSLNGVFSAWKNTLWDNIYSALTNLIIPVMILITVVFLVIGIGGLVTDRRQGGAGNSQKHITQIVISLAAILLLGSFYIWGPMILEV